MSTVNKKELLNEAVDALFVTVGAVGLSMASKKLLGDKLTDASSAKEIVKLAAGITLSTMLVKYAQDKKWLPNDPIKTS